MDEHLTVQELLTALKYCNRELGGDSCAGCPNAIPETEDKCGLCKCRFDIMGEVIHVLESIVNQKGE